ncbi:NPCBM/NEW2 domain-containing protein [Streptomyces yaizuensis]|uniref:Alpha-galactosidase n=1 Tax=Streptomyces yaizuensis TaxID=2989713 RepID=A0ABQ5P6Z9_9ACTN|nr:NPCBM/NEW2 domain-containing protein [Streptomyces sp. YSPA8]GLF98365.1 NPCBM/NEW2 domain-containing protein [Streptomyces sp. YSPA8]
MRASLRPLVGLLGLVMVSTPLAAPAQAAPAEPTAREPAARAPATTPRLPDGLAPTPPMGFNNWNSTGCAIDEKMIRDTADLFVSTGLKDAGYEYVNVDDCWAAESRDANGRLTHHPVRFPSGIKALADYVHSKGLKFGIYTSAGTLTCARTMPGALDHEEIDARTFADWGVDYLKYDNCNNQGRPALERYTKMRDALRATGRPIVYSLCEWGQNKPWEWGKDVGHLWRTTGDINDSWQSALTLFKANAPLDRYAGPGHWNDPDMLEVGNGGMTDTEYRSHFSLWAMMAAPLLIGTDLRKATPATLRILANREVIAVDQDPLGVQARVVRGEGGHWVLAKPLRGGDLAVALFNETDQTATVSTTAAELGLPRGAGHVIRDLWEGRESHTTGRISASLPAHATAVYRVRAGADWWQAPPAATLGLELPPDAEGIPGNIVPAGRTVTATTSVRNDGRLPLFAARLELAAPAGWTARALDPARAALLPPGRTLTTRWRVRAPGDAPPGSAARLDAALGYRALGQGAVRRTSGDTLTVPAPVPAGVSDLGDLAWAWASNGYGPVERDMSNGGPRGGDGRALTVNGVRYDKGLGTHAPVQLVYFLDGRCTGLTTDVGIDDERDPREPEQGTATAQIWADGVKRADSGLLTWRDPAVSLSAELRGARYLRLVGTIGPDTHRYDRIDWAAPRLTCAPRT